VQALASPLNHVFLLGFRPQDHHPPPPPCRRHRRLLHSADREDDEGLLIMGRSRSWALGPTRAVRPSFSFLYP